MTTLLQDSDHYVLRKLHNELLPWMISGRRVGRQKFVWLARIYDYIGSAAAALAGLGIGSPIVAALQEDAVGSDRLLDYLKTALPSYWFYAGVFGLILWIAFRLTVQNENMVSRALLAREYARSINALYHELYRTLAKADPINEIGDIQRLVDDKVRDAIKNNIWPWDPPIPPSDKIEGDLREQVTYIRSNYMANWSPPPPGALQ